MPMFCVTLWCKFVKHVKNDLTSTANSITVGLHKTAERHKRWQPMWVLEQMFKLYSLTARKRAFLFWLTAESAKH